LWLKSILQRCAKLRDSPRNSAITSLVFPIISSINNPPGSYDPHAIAHDPIVLAAAAARRAALDSNRAPRAYATCFVIPR
jgi:hypothetical protein